MNGKVLVVDDHRLVAIGLQLALSARSWEVQVWTEPSGTSVLEMARSFRPACVLLDVNLGEGMGSGLDLVAPLCELGCRVVMLTAETDWRVLAMAVEAGADGWVCKSAYVDEVVLAVEDVLGGRPLIGCGKRAQLMEDLRLWRADLHHAMSPFERLTTREREVLAAMVEGLTAEDIATMQIVALTTVRSQIRAILQKLGVHSQLAAVAFATRAGWRAHVHQ
jgi:DNA-binding NarL/FixJ family response regulator